MIDISETLESAIDKFGLESVLMRLSDIVAAKGEHINCNWQDYRLADQWHKAAGIIQKIADAIPDQCR